MPNVTYIAYRKFQQGIEKKYTPLLKKALQAQELQYITYAQKNSWVQAAANINIIVKTQPVEQILRRLYEECASKWGWYTFKTYRFVKGFFQDSIIAEFIDEINKFFDQYILQLVTDITNGTKKFIQQQILQGIEAGLGYDDIAKSIVNSEFNIMRARRIARTESVAASNQAAKAGAKKTGILMLKRWNAAEDNRTRNIERGDQYDHFHMDQQTIAMEDKFRSESKFGDVYLDAPGDPTAPAGERVNCRCSLSFVPQRTADGRVIRV